ncbi:hypothetical protein [Micromonospora orduensis]|uniref:hypothetical protein n=1 Tax=Micromonospora orduensis TaxID=1420891 RepID=UPI0033EDC584
MTPDDRVWIGSTLIVLGVAAALLGWPMAGIPIGCGIGTLIAGTYQRRKDIE